MSAGSKVAKNRSALDLIYHILGQHLDAGPEDQARAIIEAMWDDPGVLDRMAHWISRDLYDEDQPLHQEQMLAKSAVRAVLNDG